MQPLSLPQKLNKDFELKQKVISLPKLIAHRGASHYAPENTLAALNKAHELGAKWIEFDVMLTSRNEGIIFHDDTLDRTTNGRGKVSQTPYQAIATLDAGSWFSGEYAGEKVPTLEQWLRAAASLGLGINLEMKGSRRDAKRLAKEVFTALARHWSPTLPAPLISSKSLACLGAVRQLAPKMMLGYISNRWPHHWQKIVSQLNCVSLHIFYKRLTQLRVKQLKKAGLLVLAYTINDAADANALFEMGVDAIFTNDPLLLQ